MEFSALYTVQVWAEDKLDKQPWKLEGMFPLERFKDICVEMSMVVKINHHIYVTSTSFECVLIIKHIFILQQVSVEVK